MALVKLKVSITSGHGSFMPGDKTDWPDFDVQNVLRAGYAELVEDETTVPEAAVMETPETAVRPSARPRNRKNRG